MDAYEPWYQTTGPSDEDAVRNILNKQFFKYLHDPSKDTDNSYLKIHLKKIYKNNEVPSITYDDIKKEGDWEVKVDKIVMEEINKIKNGGLGSWRGYATFVESKLYENAVKSVLFKIGKLEKDI
ncbi:hypothetical protein N9O88_01770 [bacterium]|nr:hypothetical protein [bacterium]